MSSRGLAPFLILLIMWGWVDDLCLIAPSQPSIAVGSTSDDDQYLPISLGLLRHSLQVPPQSLLNGALAHADPASAAPFGPGRLASAGWQSLPSRNLLYAFMSMQC